MYGHDCLTCGPDCLIWPYIRQSGARGGAPVEPAPRRRSPHPLVRQGHQIPLFGSLIRTGARRNPATCGTNQDNGQTWFAPALRGTSTTPSFRAARSPNPLFRVLDLYWRSLETGDLWYESRQLKKTYLRTDNFLQTKKQFKRSANEAPGGDGGRGSFSI